MLKSIRIKVDWIKSNNGYTVKIPNGLVIGYTCLKVKESYNEKENTPFKYGVNFWIINEGHDYSKKGDVLFTRSPEVANSPVLFMCGEDVDIYCENNHKIVNGQNFCGECGVKV
jgi:hypothetical protein